MRFCFVCCYRLKKAVKFALQSVARRSGLPSWGGPQDAADAILGSSRVRKEARERLSSRAGMGGEQVGEVIGQRATKE